jgi:hypothetical protein
VLQSRVDCLVGDDQRRVILPDALRMRDNAISRGPDNLHTLVLQRCFDLLKNLGLYDVQPSPAIGIVGKRIEGFVHQL